jgi:hypothetical protein
LRNTECFLQGEFSWEKPISCHLYPVRLKHIAGFDYANFEYIPELCSAGCRRGEKEGIYLADFLEDSLTRRYGGEWYQDFLEACEEVRNGSKIDAENRPKHIAKTVSSAKAVSTADSVCEIAATANLGHGAACKTGN